MRRLGIALTLLGLTLRLAFADNGSASSQASRCQAFMAANPDLVCLSLKDARALDIKVATLQHDADIAKLKARRLGLTVGCGGGVSAFITAEWTLKGVPAGFCGAMYGWRF